MTSILLIPIGCSPPCPRPALLGCAASGRSSPPPPGLCSHPGTLGTKMFPSPPGPAGSSEDGLSITPGTTAVLPRGSPALLARWAGQEEGCNLPAPEGCDTPAERDAIRLLQRDAIFLLQRDALRLPCRHEICPCPASLHPGQPRWQLGGITVPCSALCPLSRSCSGQQGTASCSLATTRRPSPSV